MIGSIELWLYINIFRFSISRLLVFGSSPASMVMVNLLVIGLDIVIWFMEDRNSNPLLFFSARL